MTQETIVALFRSTAEAERARQDLTEAGIAPADVALRDREQFAGEQTAPAATRSQGWFDWLFGSTMPERDVQDYRSYIEEKGGAMLSVRTDESEVERIIEILERHDLVRFGEEPVAPPATSPAEARTPIPPAVAAPVPPAAVTAPGIAETMAPRVGAPHGAEIGRGGEQVIPTAREEVEIEKRRVENARPVRVRRYVVEHPVEKDVALHDERIVVETRPPTQSRASEGAFEDRIIEETERREEPVVRKVVKPGDEVVIRKEESERTERVRGVERESKVEVEGATAGNKPKTNKPLP